MIAKYYFHSELEPHLFTSFSSFNDAYHYATQQYETTRLRAFIKSEVSRQGISTYMHGLTYRIYIYRIAC